MIDLKSLRNVKYGITALAIFFIEFAVFIPLTYISSYAIHAVIASQKAYRMVASSTPPPSLVVQSPGILQIDSAVSTLWHALHLSALCSSSRIGFYATTAKSRSLYLQSCLASGAALQLAWVPCALHKCAGLRILGRGVEHNLRHGKLWGADQHSNRWRHSKSIWIILSRAHHVYAGGV